MDWGRIILNIIFGGPIASGVTLLLYGIALSASNNIGDEKPKLKDFSVNGMKFVNKKKAGLNEEVDDMKDYVK